MEKQSNPNTLLANGGGDIIGLAYYFGTRPVSLLPHGVAPPSSNVPSIVSSDTHHLRQHARHGNKQSHHMGDGGRGRCLAATGGNIRGGRQSWGGGIRGGAASDGGKGEANHRGCQRTKACWHASCAMRGHATCPWPAWVLPAACLGAPCC